MLKLRLSEKSDKLKSSIPKLITYHDTIGRIEIPKLGVKLNVFNYTLHFFKLFTYSVSDIIDEINGCISCAGWNHQKEGKKFQMQSDE